MDELYQIIKDFNVPTLIGTGFICWYFTREMHNSIKEEIKGIKEETKQIREDINLNKIAITQQAARTDRLYEMFIDLLKNK